MSTVQEIVVAAMARDARLRGDWLVTYQSELVAVVDRALKQAMLLGVQRNPSYWTARQTLAVSGGAWTRPAGATLVAYLKYGALDVVVVERENQAELGADRYAVYEEGQKFYPCTGSLLAGTETVTAAVAAMPTTLTTLSSSLDSRWPTEFNDLLILPVFAYLELKDGRPEAAQLAEQERQRWEDLFTAFLTSLTVDVERVNLEPATQPASRRGQVRGADHA